MQTPLRILCVLIALAGAAGCEREKPAAGVARTATPDRAAPAPLDVPVGGRHGVCLRLPAGGQVGDRRTEAEADLATLRRATGDVAVFVGEHPDFPGFRRVTRHAGDTVTPRFQPLAEVDQDGQRFLLFGHKRTADRPRVYVMFSGAESALAGDAHLDAGNLVDCAATP